MSNELVSTYVPKVPIWRRGVAFLIDFVVVGMLSSLLGMNQFAQGVLFFLAWLGLRVLWVAKNQGQSLGRWALDMRVIDAQYRSTPGLAELTKREGIAGVAAGLALIGIINLSPAAGWSPLLLVPLLLDLGVAFLDKFQQQAIHDRIAQTMVVQTQRGYSLDLKVKKLLADARRYMK